MMPKLPWVEFPLLAVLLIGTLMVVGARLFVKIEKTTTKRNPKDNTEETTASKAPRGIGYRMIQLISLLLIVPIVALLACEDAISKETAGAILASIAGYALGSVSKDDN